MSETSHGGVPPSARGRAGAIFAVAAAGFLLSMFYRVSATIISPMLQADLGLTGMQLSTLSAAFFYAFAVVQLPLGLVLDRYGPRLVLTVLGGVAVAGALTFASAQSIGQAYAGRILLGVGMSGNLMGAMALIVHWFPRHRFAFLAGLITALGTLGMSSAATPLALLVDAVGWRLSFAAIAALNAVQAAAFYAVVRDRPPGAARPRASGAAQLRGLGYILARPFYWIISLTAFVRFGAIMGLQALWAGPFLHYGVGLTLIETGNALLACSLGYMVSLPLSGWLSDSVVKSRKWVVSPAMVVFAVLMLALAGLERGAAPWLVVVLFLAIGLAAAPGQVMYAHIKELLPSEMAARGLTGINLFNMLGPAVLTQAAGLLLAAEPSAITEPGGFAPIWVFFAALLLIAAVAYAFTPGRARPV